MFSLSIVLNVLNPFKIGLGLNIKTFNRVWTTSR